MKTIIAILLSFGVILPSKSQNIAWYEFNDASTDAASFQVFSHKTGLTKVGSTPLRSSSKSCANALASAIKMADRNAKLSKYGRFLQFDTALFIITRTGKGCAFTKSEPTWLKRDTTLSLYASNGNPWPATPVSNSASWAPADNQRLISYTTWIYTANPKQDLSKEGAVVGFTDGWHFEVGDANGIVNAKTTANPKTTGGAGTSIGIKIRIYYESIK